MIYLKIFEDFKNTTYEVKKKSSYINPSDKKVMLFNHEYFVVRVDNIIVSSCIITYPKLSPNKFKKDGSNAFTIYAGGEELFDDDDDKFVKIYDVKSRKKGKGYGKLLFEELSKYLKNKGINRLYIDVDKENLRAHDFYKKIGFKKIYDGTFDIGYSLIF